MPQTRDHVLVLVTCGSEDEARAIARHLVENRLAAGVQVVPIQSLYWWEDAIVGDAEWLLIAKTRRQRFEEIEKAVGELHSYEVPPVLLVGMEQASGPYLDWIDAMTTADRINESETAHGGRPSPTEPPSASTPS